MIYITVILNSIFFIIFLIFSGYWAFIFIKRIYCCRKYKIGVTRCLSDESGYLNKQYYYHYETEIWKNVLLLLMTFSEIVGSSFLFASNTTQHYLKYRQLGNDTLELPLSNCISYKKPELNQIDIMYAYIPYLNGMTAITRSAEIFLVAFGICLMNYLIIRIKKIRNSYNTLNYRIFLTVTTLLNAVIILTGFIQYTVIVSNIILFFIFSIVYLCIFIRTAKRFKRALLQRALERLIQHGSNKEEIKQYTYCKHTINIMSCGYLFIILSQTFLDTPELLVSALFYGNCYFPFNLFPSLNYVIQTEEAIETFAKVIQYTRFIGCALCLTTIVVTLFPFVFITICIWIKHIHKCFHGNKKIKYSTVPKA